MAKNLNSEEKTLHAYNYVIKLIKKLKENLKVSKLQHVKYN